jgi:DNA-binding response OmpR family regulator
MNNLLQFADNDLPDILYLDDSEHDDIEDIVGFFSENSHSKIFWTDSVKEFHNWFFSQYPYVKLLILDVMMPDNELLNDQKSLSSKGNTENGYSTGLVLKTEIRKNNPNVPIIVMSARKDLNNELPIFNADPKIVFHRRFKLEDISASINAFLSQGAVK